MQRRPPRRPSRLQPEVERLEQLVTRGGTKELFAWIIDRARQVRGILETGQVAG
jgi:hypothetical protein